MTGVDGHSMRRHGMLNLVIDRLAGSLDTENIASLHDVVRSRLDAIHTICTHNFCQPIPGDKQSIDAAVFLVFRDNTSIDLGETLDLNICDESFQVLQTLVGSVGFLKVLQTGLVDVDSYTSGLLVGRNRLICKLSSRFVLLMTYAFLDLELCAD